MKVLYLTKYSRMGASSRLRSFQYFPAFKECGIEVVVRPLFNDEYLSALYKGEKSLGAILKAYVFRFLMLFTLFKYDKVVIEKELFPYFPAFFEQVIAFFGVKYLVDYDDAIFHNYDLHSNKWVRLLLQHKIGTVMRNAETVIAGNSYLAAKAENSGAGNTVIVPTVIDISRYEVKQNHIEEKTVIGWIGSPSTYKYVKAILPVIERLALKYPIEFHVVGASERYDGNAILKTIRWTEESEIQSILNFDIGVMPLEDSPWEKGKCAYKLIQYMGCGIPVVASPVGMNEEVVEADVNGFLANNSEDWYLAMERLITQPEMRMRMGKKGREKVEKEYSLHQKAATIITLLKK